MDYIYGNINKNLVTINRLEYVELRKCEIANQPIEGLNVGDFYLAFKVFDCKKLIYCSLAEMNRDIIDELNTKLDGKVDKIEKTNNWRVYGVGSKELDLPNGDSIDVSDQSIPNTLINRNANGTAQINNPVDNKDIANKQYIDKAIENIELRNDVVDIVGTYQELQSYDTSTLTANDVIKVLQDNTHNNASTYYKWNGTSFDFVGEEGPYYTQTQVDEKLDKKLDKVAKTNKWQLYGVGSIETPLPNGNTINIEHKAVPNTVINRDGSGRAQVENPTSNKDIANKEYVDNSLKNYVPLASYNESLTDIANNKTDIANIKKVIPSQANENNQLADKNFVNSTINSNAAFFIGNFNTYADLETWQNENPSKATNNDYAYINSDEKHNGEAWRYQYVKKDNEVVGIWKAQFKVNDTPLTAEQLAAINSGVTKETINDINSKIPTDINAKSQFFYADLILEHNGQEIAGQKKLAKIPAWRLIDDADYPIPVKTFMKSQFINIVNLGINNDIFFPSLSESILFCKRDKDTNDWVGFDVDTTVKTPGTTGIQILLTNANTKTINGENIYGPGNIEAIPVYDFTSLDFTNVLSTLSDEGYVSIDITDETMKNDLKTIFDRLQNNKTSFIEFPQLQSGGGTDEEIQQTRMFALIQNSIYLGTGIYGLYGLMYFYHYSDMLIKIRIDTNFDSYYSIVLENVENKFVNKSSVKKIVYATNSEGAQINLPYALNPGNNNLAQFDTNGHLYTNTPSVDLHATNKKYVEDNFEKKTILSNVLPTDNILLDLHNYQLESPITSDFSFIMPANASDEYLSEISFTTGPTLVAFTTTSAITFTGEDCSNTHTFVPDTNKHYNIIFWKDKAGFQAVVRGY